MKKLILITLVALFSLGSYAQDGMRLGVNVGLPIGDAGDFYNLNVAADLSFLWGVSDTFSAGIATGYSHWFGDEFTDEQFNINIEIEDAGFIPIAGAARLSLGESFVLGADLGYAIGISPDGNDGGFYYAPRVQYGIGQNTALSLSYRGISNDGSSADAITLGVEFGI